MDFEGGASLGAQQYSKHEIVALGITTPALRAFVRDRVQKLPKAWQAQQAIELCDRLLRESEMEIRGAGFLVLGAFDKQLTPGLLKRAERWFKRRLDNWALVDGFCGTVLSPLLEQYPEVESTLAVWSRAESLWLRHAAAILDPDGNTVILHKRADGTFGQASGNSSNQERRP